MLRRSSLRQPRNDHLRADVVRELLELGVVGEEDKRLLRQPLAQGGVRHSALAEDDDVLGVVAFLAKPAMEGKGEVLVEEKLHAAFTAGGWCAAT
jgi:hypothetical protein